MTDYDKLPDVLVLEAELHRLLGLKSGYSQPDRLDFLEYVLQLDIVRAEIDRATGDRMLKRAGGVRAVLDLVTGNIRDERTRDAARILFFLDQDEEELQRTGIEARRDAIERRLGFRDFRRGEEQRIRATVAGELLRHELLHRLSARTPSGASVTVTLVRDADDLHRTLHVLVQEAEAFLGCTGSRSREAAYLGLIERRLEDAAGLTHVRVLWGPPHHQVLKDHLRAVDRIAASHRRRDAGGSVHIGIFDDWRLEPERFVVVNDDRALVVLPPFSDVGHYDSAIVFSDEAAVESLRRYIWRLFNGGRRLDAAAIESLEVLRGG